ncbi:MAG: serine/threonine protein kinase [Richelia sp. SL_2_1]|nr:serine/threonine protein kinase [Richelia sp. SL_2_1]
MQPPISADTVLQNRYKIIKILGQGGFGRTYLAEDQRRFNELCAIKELIPNATGTSAWEKAQELFAREAAILYQIKHPQIPQFREKFEQDQRLFLVQDYVEGKTYYDLLAERKTVGGAFTEAEVLRLMRSLLPVLDYIHGKGIIHRDISPDNIIMRESDKLPVLIDFGVVKELATRLRSRSTTPETYVGKPGYCPSEQIQTGQAYPSSDLYALAVSAIVLLTGKEPTELFDDNLLSWNWQRWVSVNPRFAQILNRMLSNKPGGRYQSVMEVLEAFDFLNQPTAAKPDLSGMRTVAVGGRLDPVQPPRRQPDPVIPPPRQDSVVDNPLAVGAIAALVVAFAGLGSWALVRTIRNASDSQTQSPPPQTFASPFLTPTPTPNNEPIVFSKRLNLGLSNTATIRGRLKANQTIQYTFDGQEEQSFTAILVEENGVSLSVLGPNQELIDNAARQVSFYEGKLPFTGQYTIELNNLPDIQEAQYILRVRLREPELPTPTPTPTPTEETPTPIEETPTPSDDNVPNSDSPSLSLPPIKVPSILKPTPSEDKTINPTMQPTPQSESDSTTP